MIYLDCRNNILKNNIRWKAFWRRICEKDGKHYFILPSNIIKSKNLTPERSCGHMANASENEIIALAQGAKKNPEVKEAKEATILDLGSRDAKWIKFRHGKFHDMDWNTSCASSTGATVEMLLKFYSVKPDELKFTPEKFAVTCGIFGMEKIMDSISSGAKPSEAISKFVHGIGFNAWNFCKKPDKIYLSGGFCRKQMSGWFAEKLLRSDSARQVCPVRRFDMLIIHKIYAIL